MLVVKIFLLKVKKLYLPFYIMIRPKIIKTDITLYYQMSLYFEEKLRYYPEDILKDYELKNLWPATVETDWICFFREFLSKFVNIEDQSGSQSS